jgi:hypothetical protein
MGISMVWKYPGLMRSSHDWPPGDIVFGEDAIVRRVSIHGRTVRSCGCGYTRNGADAIEQLFNEWVPACLRQIYARKSDIRD